MKKDAAPSCPAALGKYDRPNGKQEIGGAPKGDDLDQIKRVAIAAMFADDELLDQLVLKGGNAMDIVLQIHSRTSLDLDVEQATKEEARKPS